MSSEENNQDVAVDIDNGGEGEGETTDVVTIPKSEWEKTQRTVGSLKRQLKDSTKPKEESEAPKSSPKPDDALLQRVEKLALKTAQITHSEDVELMRTFAKKWNMDIEDVINDEDALAKLERQRTSRSNVEATSGVKGGKDTASSAKETVEYWVGKDQPPTPDDVPNKATRQKIISGLINAQRTNKSLKFYNDK